jgi:hypothetical protein
MKIAPVLLAIKIAAWQIIPALSVRAAIFLMLVVPRITDFA